MAIFFLFSIALIAFAALASSTLRFFEHRPARAPDVPRRNARQVQGFPPERGRVERNLFKRLPRFA